MVGRKPSRILVVDDRILARMGLWAVLRDHGSVEMAGHASSAEQAVSKVLELKPDVVVIDSHAHAIDPVATTQLVAKRCGATMPAVLVLVSASDDQVQQVVDAPGRGLLLDRASVSQLVSAIRLVAAGYSLLPPTDSHRPSVVRRSRRDVAQVDGSLLARLTERERDVLQLIARGYTNAQVAGILFLSESTVKSHTRHILEKLELRSRVHAAIYAHEFGLVGEEMAGVVYPAAAVGCQP